MQPGKSPVTLQVFLNTNVSSSYYWVYTAWEGCYASYGWGLPMMGAEKLVAGGFAALLFIFSLMN